MVTDLSEIRRLGESKAAENLEFRRFLSAHHHNDDEFQILATAIERQTDCTQCANCCRHSIVAVSPADVEAIAAYLRCDVAEVMRLYTIADPEDSSRRVLNSGEEGCTFLDANLCTIYEARPLACRAFPHVALGKHTLGSRLSSHVRWASLCPIIYNALETYKHRVGYSGSRHEDTPRA